MSHEQSDEMEAEASKKRQKENVTPPSQIRSTKTQRQEEEKEDDQAQENEDGPAEKQEIATRRALFPPTEETGYKTYYTKANQRGKEPRWKPQKATIEERAMQAATPQTAKKQPASSSNQTNELSQQLESQIQEAKATMAKMQDSMSTGDHPPYIQEMQQQLLNLQENVRKLEDNTKHLKNDIKDVDILAQYVHDTVYAQQQREVARQTVAKGWPQEFGDGDRDRVINWYTAKAGVENLYKTTHGRYMYGRYKSSPITINIGMKTGQSRHSRTTYTSATTNTTQ